jgi:hypothetical protein
MARLLTVIARSLATLSSSSHDPPTYRFLPPYVHLRISFCVTLVCWIGFFMQYCVLQYNTWLGCVFLRMFSWAEPAAPRYLICLRKNLLWIFALESSPLNVADS